MMMYITKDIVIPPTLHRIAAEIAGAAVTNLTETAVTDTAEVEQLPEQELTSSATAKQQQTPVIAEKAKSQQARTEENRVCQISDEQAIDTKKELAKVAGVSHDTISKVERIEEAARASRAAYYREYRKKNGDRMRENERKWRSKNPDKVRAAQQRYWEKKGRQALEAAMAEQTQYGGEGVTV